MRGLRPGAPAASDRYLGHLLRRLRCSRMPLRHSQCSQVRHGQHRHYAGGHRSHREAAVRAEGTHCPADRRRASRTRRAGRVQPDKGLGEHRPVDSRFGQHRAEDQDQGIASPVSATPNPSSNGEPATSNGRQPIASPAAATASCTRGTVPPGVLVTSEWRPDPGSEPRPLPSEVSTNAGVARKP